jgi:hypothetical protein
MIILFGSLVNHIINFLIVLIYIYFLYLNVNKKNLPRSKNFLFLLRKLSFLVGYLINYNHYYFSFIELLEDSSVLTLGVTSYLSGNELNVGVTSLDGVTCADNSFKS